MCCHDWSCWGFTFYPKGFTGNNTALWPHVKLSKHPPVSINCAASTVPPGIECIGDNLSPLGNQCDDPAMPCCVLLSDFADDVVPSTIAGARSGLRGRLPARDPPPGTERSKTIKNITFGDTLYIGGQTVYPKSHESGSWDLGDEFPTTWSDDGYQYAGAGDNSGGVAYPGSDSPLTMWRIEGMDPPSATFTLVGAHQPVNVSGRTLPHFSRRSLYFAAHSPSLLS